MKKLNKLYLIVAFMFVGYSCEITDLDQLNNPNAVTAENAGLDLYWNAVQTSFGGWWYGNCLLYTSPSPRDRTRSRMPSSA